MPQGVEIVEVELPDGSTFDAEVAVSRMADVAAWDRFRVDQLKDSVEKVTAWVWESVREALPDQPDKVGVQFGLKLAVKSGKLTSVLAEAGGEASVTISLEWNKRDD
jgi:hypothetical protein